MEFNTLLRKMRVQFKFAQKDIALLLGVERSTYSNYELGKTTPSYETLRRIKRIFKVPLDYLIDYDDYQKEAKLQNNPAAAVSDTDRTKGLSKDEIMLLACYRVAEKEDRQGIIEMVRNFTAEKSRASQEENKKKKK